MDRSIVQASRALQAGNPLEALRRIGVRRDAHALAVRGIALAQLGELDRARDALALALRRFRRAREPIWIVKARAALAEIDWAARDLVGAARRLDSGPLRRIGDLASAAYVDIQKARLLAFVGKGKEAERLLAGVAWGPAAVLARAELLAFRGRFRAAAKLAKELESPNPLLAGEARRLFRELTRPGFRYGERAVSLADLESIREPYVDTIRKRFGSVDLSRRPVQFELMVALARGPVAPEKLFPAANESHRVRLNMEVSRLRRATGLRIRSTPRGFVMEPVGLLLPGTDPIEALLADGQAWPPRAIAAALGLTVRSVERALADSPRVTSVGRGRSVRYRLRRVGPGIATQLLLLSERRKP